MESNVGGAAVPSVVLIDGRCCEDGMRTSPMVE